MSEIVNDLKRNPAAWIYTAMTDAQARKCGSVVVKKRINQAETISHLLGFVGWTAAQYQENLNNFFKAKYGYHIQDGINRMMHGLPPVEISGIHGVDDDVPRADMSVREVDPETGLPISTIRAAIEAEEAVVSGCRVGETTTTGVVPTSWLAQDTPKLGLDETLGSFAKKNMLRAWTVQDPNTGVVYSMTINTKTGLPNGVYRQDTGEQVSWYDEAKGFVPASTVGVKKFEGIFDSICSSLDKVSQMLSTIFSWVLQGIALDQATQGKTELWSFLASQNTNQGLKNTNTACQQQDSSLYGVGAGGKSSGFSFDFPTIALIGIGVYLVVKGNKS